ncbi:endonuclease [Streptomyces sp. NPDC015127]|uniref:endonuclease n=1 Tax=Streptomyces sp. NPDC015127 TaxID=3364939 RepID=UPI003702E81C
MTTSERVSEVEADYVSQLEAAARRYADRTAERERTRSVLDDRGVLYADEPERVGKRLARLGADWSLARAIDQSPTQPATTAGSTLPVPPDSFSADVLGLERLIGRNNLTPVAFLEDGTRAARAVGRITTNGPGGGHGTGFMVSPSLLLTNNHVLRSKEAAGRSVVAFNLQAGPGGEALDPVVFPLEPERFFVTDRALDFSLVAVAQRNARGDPLSAFGWLPLSGAQGKVILGEFVNVIQHPRGEPKQLALRENQVVDLLERFLHYASDTDQGSSGSPVFNDQWEVVALHHSAVPVTDSANRPLSIDGSVWTPAMGEHRIAWKANEGVRISRVLQALREITLTGAEARLRDEVFTAAAAPPSFGASRRPAGQPSLDGAAAGESVTASADGVAVPRGEVAGGGTAVFEDAVRFTIPLRFTVSLGPAGPADGMGRGREPAPRAVVAPAGAPPVPGADGQSDAALAVERDVDAALVNFRLGQERVYFDRATDNAARDAYYAGIRAGDGKALRRALTRLLEDTHAPRPRYQPIRLVYPWVDLHKDGRLRSIYSGRTFTAEEFIRADAAVETARIARLEELLLRESTAGPAELAAEFDALEASMPFNCEHVVPQSWFTKEEPMRGDLHHLFACEVGCNSFRGNFPYVDFPGFEEAVRHECGMREAVGFEPEEGKGAVARATLYFLLRYPGLVGDAAREFPENRLPLLLSWHDNEPVSEYELHRNAAIAEIQGNRNPLIDHPEWAHELDFSGVWP